MDQWSEVCTVREASARLRVSCATIRRLIAKAAIPAVRVGRSVRINRTALDRIVNEGGVSRGK